NTGAMQTGFQNIPEQKKTVYYNGQGQMQYGQQRIQGKWYLFAKNTGAITKGFNYIAGQNKMVYYNKQGQMLYGTQKINGHSYEFNKNTGALGVKAGQQWIDGHWYLFDQNRVMQTGFRNITGQKKTVYYNNQGQMQYGQQQIQSKWYLFDKSTGAMQKGFKSIPEQKKTVYYNGQGQMQYGQQQIQSKWYLFDKSTGAMQKGFKSIPEQKKTVYYNGQGQMQYGQQQIQSKWYLFDKNTGAMQTGFQNIPEQKKTVYYNGQGQMQYGQQRIQGKWYLFAKNTGAMQTGFQNISGQNKTVYYNNQGQMLYAWQTINSDRYYFDKDTGAMTKGTVRIDGDKYDFDKNGVLLDQSKYDIQTYRNLAANDINSKLEKNNNHTLNIDLSSSQDNYAAFSLHDEAQLIAQGDLSDDVTVVENYLQKNANMNGTTAVYRANVTAASAAEAAQKTASLFTSWYESANDFSWTSLGVGGIRDLDNNNSWTGAIILYKAIPDKANTPSSVNSKIIYKVDTVYSNEAITSSEEDQLQEGMTVSETEVDNSDNNGHLEKVLQGGLGQKISTDSLKVIANSIGGVTTALVGTKQYLDGNGQTYHYEFWLDGQTAALKEQNFINSNVDASYGDVLVAKVSATAIYEKEQSAPNIETPTSQMTNDQITAAYQKGTETGLKYETVNIEPIEGMTQDMIRGVDISSYIALKNAGVKFYDFDGKEASLIKILHDAGVNYLRLRIWNDPYDSENNSYGGGASDEANMLEIAREASHYGMKLAIDFQYSDFWTDPGKQVVPKAWKNLTNSGLEQAVYLYTKKVMTDFKNSGANVGMVQIGNEITNGLLGIVASRDQGESYASVWNNAQSAGKISDYLVAGAHAVRESTPDAKVVIHIETPNVDKYSAIMTSLKNNGVDYDVLGSSYYPFWSTNNDNGQGLGKGANTPMNLAAVEKMVQEKYGKQFVILETGWVNSLQDADGTGNSISSNTNAYSVGPQGQVDAMRDMYQVLVKQGGLGAFYWEPAWIPVKAGWDNWQYNKDAADLYGTGWASKYAVGYAPDNVMYYQGQPAWGGTTWDNVTLFDDQGYPLQSLNAFKGFLKS
ncbi:glycosyl hydrolase 53 family protein, partial [Liquorilactobacillus uvarum]|uniref:glycosyl hydrolase 53 family protein n=2 Tax=Liquorilactobacillus uvarum TaxID=303240 RepID=UPI00288AD196